MDFRMSNKQQLDSVQETKETKETKETCKKEYTKEYHARRLARKKSTFCPYISPEEQAIIDAEEKVANADNSDKADNKLAALKRIFGF